MDEEQLWHFYNSWQEEHEQRKALEALDLPPATD